MTTLTRTSLLRQVLVVDTAICAISGVMLLAAPAAISTLTNISATILQIAGVILLVAASVMAYVSTRNPISRRGLWPIIVLNSIWMLESIALPVLGWMTPNGLGWAALIGQMLVVLGFTLYYIRTAQS